MESKSHSGLVSIVIPTYTQKKYIGRAIQSVLDDPYPTKEILVVSDGSVDQTPKIVEDLKMGTTIPVKLGLFRVFRGSFMENPVPL